MPDSSERPDQGHGGGQQDAHKPIPVLWVWGGTGSSKKANAKPDQTAGDVFDEVYNHFKHTPTAEDTYQVGQQDFDRARFGETVKQLAAQYPDNQPLEFEVMPPTQGA